MDLREVALSLYRSGLNVLPARKAQKRPVGAWKQFAQTRPTFEEAFPRVDFDAIAVVCGATSGGLEIIDFDQRAKLYPAWQGLVGDKLLGLTVESTQNGGKHVAFRSNSCGRNQKLAMTPEVAVETRGEGGICIIAPTDGYKLEAGSWEDVKFLSDADRELLINAAKSLSVKQSAPDSGESVADRMRRVEAGKDALLRAGWTFLREDAEWEYWRRPGQTVEDKHGATFSKKDQYFHVFTSNGFPFEQDKSYSHLQIVALLDYGGDMSEASRRWGKREKHIDVIETFNPFDVEKKEEKKKFPERLFNVGGLIQELQDVINEHAIRPQPEGAFLGALADMSFLAGRTLALNYSGTLVTPNIYALFLAPSGMGKEIVRRVGIEVARAYNSKESVPESFASVQALQNLIARVRKILWLHDEFGRDLAVMNDRKTNSNITGVITESLKLYSNANNRAYLPKLVAQEAKGAKRVDPVDRPSLTIFATGNPREFFDATNEEILTNGYISRFTIVQGRTYSEKRATSFEEATTAPAFELPASLKSRIKKWADFESASVDPTLCGFDRAAFECVTAFDAAVEKELKFDALAGGWIAEFKARLFEKVWKYALLFAASKYGVAPSIQVDRECAENAVALATYESDVFTSNQDRFASNEQTRLMQNVVDWCKSLPGQCFTKSQFTRKFQRNGSLRERDEALRSLVEGEYLAPCEIERNGETKKGFILQ